MLLTCREMPSRISQLQKDVGNVLTVLHKQTVAGSNSECITTAADVHHAPPNKASAPSQPDESQAYVDSDIHLNHSDVTESHQNTSDQDDAISSIWCSQKTQQRRVRRKRAGATTRVPEHTVTLVCDSIPKNLDTGYLARKTSTTVKITRTGSTIGHTVDHIQDHARDRDTPVIIHTGTNHLEKEGVSTTIRRLERLEANLLHHKYKRVMISSVVHRNESPVTHTKITTINNRLAMMCAKHRWTFVDNDNIDETCLSADGVHLNGIGDERLTLNIAHCLKHLLH